MNNPESKPIYRVWEIPVHILVTIPLLIVGAVLWLFGLIVRILTWSRRQPGD